MNILAPTDSAAQSRLPSFPQLNGIFVLNKPSGPSSAQCLRLFKKLGQKKAGHAGTLDPAASGVLLVLLGQASKLSSHLMEGGAKVYSGLFKLGVETDTWDAQGRVLASPGIEGVSEARVMEEMARFQGVIEQEVPPYSAAKHNGQPLYKLARKSLPAPAKTKKIEIFDAAVLYARPPFVEFRISCSSGSYIRSLAHSLGKRLGCGAILHSLVREYSHPYSLDQALGLEDLEKNPDLLHERLMPLQSALPSWPAIAISLNEARAIRNGASIPADQYGGTMDRCVLCEGGSPLALARLACESGRKRWKITRGLW